MCYSRDHQRFEDRQKEAQEQAKRERRTGVIDKLLNDASKEGDKTKETTPIKDVTPAK